MVQTYTTNVLPQKRNTLVSDILVVDKIRSFGNNLGVEEGEEAEGGCDEEEGGPRGGELSMAQHRTPQESSPGLGDEHAVSVRACAVSRLVYSLRLNLGTWVF